MSYELSVKEMMDSFMCQLDDGINDAVKELCYGCEIGE